jgi:hypothetical protein
VYLSDALQLRAQLAEKQHGQPWQQKKQQLLHPQQKPAKQQQQQGEEGEGDSSYRMCLNEFCKSPFESPQWRRGPLGPGTLCNACGTRFARMEAKKKGDKKVGAYIRGWQYVLPAFSG